MLVGSQQTCRHPVAGEAPKRQHEGPRVVDIVRGHGKALIATTRLRCEQRDVLELMAACRTAELGGQQRHCPSCKVTEPVYNSCANRHCTTCSGLSKAKWVAKRAVAMVPVPHFGVVFTLPAQLRQLARTNTERVLGRMMTASAWVLQREAASVFKARLGISAVTHTWSRSMAWHPHVHCIVTGGGVSHDEATWVPSNPTYLFDIADLRDAFRDRLLHLLTLDRKKKRLTFTRGCAALGDDAVWLALVGTLSKRTWVVHISKPTGKTASLLKYLAQYTHQVAISDTRIVSFADGRVTFATRGDDDDKPSGKKTETVSAHEFLQRFIQHVLPKRFNRIRHYGLYSSEDVRSGRLARAISRVPAAQTEVVCSEVDKKIAAANDWLEVWSALFNGVDPMKCPHCEDGRLVTIGDIPPLPTAPRAYKRWRSFYGSTDET